MAVGDRKTRTRISAILLLIFLGSLPWSASGQHAGDLVVKRGTYGDDLYAVGRSVDVDATVSGDVVAAGGNISVAGRIRGDVLAAGGNLTLKGRVDDDVRVAGGSLDLDLQVGDDLLAAGGQIRTSAPTRVGGNAWIAGGTVNLSGEFAHDLVVSAGELHLGGRVRGNAKLTADTITFLPGTVIDGNLSYRSKAALNLNRDVIVRGKVTRLPYREIDHERLSLGAGPSIVFYISLYLVALVLSLVFAHFSSGAAERLRSQPLFSFGLGFVVLVVPPVAAILALVMVLTFLPGLVLLALYPVALLTGLVIGMIWLGESAAHLVRRDASSSPGMRALSLLVALVVLALIDLVPILGGLTWFLLTLFGLGAGALQIARGYSGTA